MRGELERAARRWWAGEYGTLGSFASLATLPMSWCWAGGAWLHRARWGGGRAATVPGIAVISVGNVAVGGTGKTPVARWIASTLASWEFATAVVVGRGAADEATLHARALPHGWVITDSDRLAAVRRATREGAQVAVLDDAFQHYRVERDLDVVLLSAEDPFPAPLLPRGPYREPASALRRADVILLTRRRATLERCRDLAVRVESETGCTVTASVHLAPGKFRHLDGAPCEAPTGAVLAVCGIARPELFRSAVQTVVDGPVEVVAFRDHYRYTPADAEEIRRQGRGRPIVMTEKDAVKLGAHADTLGPAYVLGEDVRWDWGLTELSGRLRKVTRGVGTA